MWALGKEDSIRHDYGRQERYCIAICGHKAEYPLDYNAVEIPKCERCLSLWPTYKGNGGKKP